MSSHPATHPGAGFWKSRFPVLDRSLGRRTVVILPVSFRRMRFYQVGCRRPGKHWSLSLCLGMAAGVGFLDDFLVGDGDWVAGLGGYKTALVGALHCKTSSPGTPAHTLLRQFAQPTQQVNISGTCYNTSRRNKVDRNIFPTRTPIHRRDISGRSFCWVPLESFLPVKYRSRQNGKATVRGCTLALLSFSLDARPAMHDTLLARGRITAVMPLDRSHMDADGMGRLLLD